MEILKSYIDLMAGNSVAILVVIMILFDTVFGFFRAAKNHSLNSSFGIDGGLRKVCMLAAIAFLGLIDMIIGINLVGLVPQEYLSQLPVQRIGCMEFFGLLYVVYEALSVLKNMRIMGLPMPQKVNNFLDKLLKDLTDEIKEPDPEDAGLKKLEILEDEQ